MKSLTLKRSAARPSMFLSAWLFACLFAWQPVGLSTSAQAVETLGPTEQDLLGKLAQGNTTEVELGGLAQRNASNPEVKNFGRRMVKDHAQLRDQALKFAADTHTEVPHGLSEEGRTTLKDLSAKKAADFDQAYVKDMLTDHCKDIAELQKYAVSGQNLALKNLIAKALPIMENHMRIAEHLATSVGLPPDAGLNQPEHPSG